MVYVYMVYVYMVYVCLVYVCMIYVCLLYVYMAYTYMMYMYTVYVCIQYIYTVCLYVVLCLYNVYLFTHPSTHWGRMEACVDGFPQGEDRIMRGRTSLTHTTKKDVRSQRLTDIFLLKGFKK
jgi:hypothetical protein